jgi:phosphoglycerol transferase MdoB-like AlkP superfamily enzyme
MRVVLNIGLVVSAVFGLGHFIIPAVFDWSNLMSGVPRYIVVSVEWINLILSLLLSGYSILLIVFQKRIKQKEKTALTFFGFLVFVYLVKSIMTIVNPWGMAVADTIEISSSILEFILLLLPFIYYLKKGSANPVTR